MQCNLGKTECSSGRYNPTSKCRSQVCPHDHPDRFHQSEQLSIHKAHHHNSGGGGGLHQAGNQQSGHQTKEAVLGHGCHDPPHSITRHFLNAFTHYPHSKKKDSQTTEDIKQSHDEFPSCYISHDSSNLGFVIRCFEIVLEKELHTGTETIGFILSNTTVSNIVHLIPEHEFDVMTVEQVVNTKIVLLELIT